MGWWLPILIYLTFVAQATWGNALAVAGLQPDFVLLMLFWLMPRLRGWQALLCVMACGIMADGLSAATPGIETAVFALTAFFWQHLHRRGAGRSALLSCPWLVAVALFKVLCVQFLRHCCDGEPLAWGETALYGLLSGLFLVAISLGPVACATCYRIVRGDRLPAPRVQNRWNMLTE